MGGNKPEELRAYFFNNMYLTGIHAGIQAQHCTAEMFLKYGGDRAYPDNNMMQHWADTFKTTIVLNGGYASNLIRIATLLASNQNPYPWAEFTESEDALNGCITSVGVVLPEKIFNYERSVREKAETGWGAIAELSDFEKQLAKEVSACRLMS